MNIDFSKAPEGATHYGSNGCWYRNIDSSGKSYEVWFNTKVKWKYWEGRPLTPTLHKINKFQNKEKITEDDLVGGLHVVEVKCMGFCALYLFLQKSFYLCWKNPKIWSGLTASWEITKVWEVKPDGLRFTYGSDKYLTLIWEKPAKEEPIEEMTVAQVSAALGKKIKIIEG